MLDQLVESKDNHVENNRRSKFVAFIGVIAALALITAWTVSLFGKDFGMGGDDLALTTLVAPVPPDEEPPPKEEPKPEKQVAADTRKELIASIDMSPKEPPKEVSTQKMNKMTIRPDFNYKLGDSDSNATVKADSGRGTQVDSGSPSGISGAPVAAATDDEAPPPPKKVVPKTVSGGVLNGKATSLPKPAYPAAARAVRASGTVTVQVTISESGSVISASAVGGHPLLQAAAVSAARGARFSPTLLSGQPVKVTGVITYNFIP